MVWEVTLVWNNQNEKFWVKNQASSVVEEAFSHKDSVPSNETVL